MPEQAMSADDLLKMIADYMENGFLENIIDMFRHDSSLYNLVGALIQDERMRVRIGVTALVEELARLDAEHVAEAVPELLRALEHTEPFIRGDAANLMGIIGDSSALPSLRKAAERDEDPNVRLLAEEAINDIDGKNP
jgi:HEAT repeat protein